MKEKAHRYSMVEIPDDGRLRRCQILSNTEVIVRYVSFNMQIAFLPSAKKQKCIRLFAAALENRKYIIYITTSHKGLFLNLNLEFPALKKRKMSLRKRRSRPFHAEDKRNKEINSRIYTAFEEYAYI